MVLVVCLVILGSLFIANFQSAGAEGTYQTWPSRTPTPANEPTKAPGGPTPGGGDPPTATAESTPVDPETSTPISIPASPAATTVSTGESTEAGEEVFTGDGQLPDESSGGCEIPPSVQSKGRIAVKDAPGVDAFILGYLETAETRKIIGRSEIVPWWLIQFAPDLQGWVPDTDVLVLGYTGYVPAILISDETTSTTATWNPTPNPQCTPAPVATTANVNVGMTSGVSGDQQEATDSDQVDIETGSSTNLADKSTPASDQPETSTEDLEINPDQPSYLWLLITGVFLIVAGVLSLLLRRRSS